MTIKMTPPRTPYHMVNYLHTATNNMQEVSRIADVPINLLWAARKKRSYAFRTPIYTKGLKQAYMTHRKFDEFPAYIEEHLSALRGAYELANADGQIADKKPLDELLRSLWPLVDYNNGDFSASSDKEALHYLSGTMMLVADLRNCVGEYFPDDKLQRAIDDFTAASAVDVNPALRHRTLLALSGAKQRKFSKQGRGFIPLSDVLDQDELEFLLDVQVKQTNNSVTDALNALKLASVLNKREMMLEAEKDLLLQDSRFHDLTFAGWSPISPVIEDPDLQFYRETKFH